VRSRHGHARSHQGSGGRDGAGNDQERGQEVRSRSGDSEHSGTRKGSTSRGASNPTWRRRTCAARTRLAAVPVQGSYRGPASSAVQRSPIASAPRRGTAHGLGGQAVIVPAATTVVWYSARSRQSLCHKCFSIARRADFVHTSAAWSRRSAAGRRRLAKEEQGPLLADHAECRAIEALAELLAEPDLSVPCL